jgi:hypothetical protein
MHRVTPASIKAASIHPADRIVSGLPTISGELDAEYLSAALARAGRPMRVGHVDCSPLGGGRISANVFSLKADTGAFVLKKFAPEPWRLALFGSAFNEPALWASGLTRNLPEPLSCPTIDIAFHRDRGECWMLMDDVSAGVAPRGSFDEATFRQLLDGLARLHGRYWEQTAVLAEAPVLTLEQHTAMFTDPCAAAAGQTKPTAWVAEVLDKVFVFRTYVPVLLDVLGSTDGDFYLDLYQHWSTATSGGPMSRRCHLAASPCSTGTSPATRPPPPISLGTGFCTSGAIRRTMGWRRRTASRCGTTTCAAWMTRWVDGSTGRRSTAPGTSAGSRRSHRSASALPIHWSARRRRMTLRGCGRSAPRRSARQEGSRTRMSHSARRRHDEWTCLDASGTAAAAMTRGGVRNDWERLRPGRVLVDRRCLLSRVKRTSLGQ